MSFLSGIFNNVNTPDVTYASPSAVSRSAAGGNELSSLSSGDIISGKVLNNNGGNITIELPGGTQIQAKLSDAVSVSEGQDVNFEYKGVLDNKIVLSPLYTNVSNASTAMKALSAASLPVNELTMSMADSMIEAGKSINKDALLSMYKDISTYKDTEPQNIMAMKDMGIELNPENVQKFEAFKNYESRITEGIKDIVRDIPTAFNEIMNEAGEGKAANFLSDVIKTFAANTLTEDMPDVLIKDEGSDANNASVSDAAVPGKTVIADTSVFMDRAIISDNEQNLQDIVSNKNVLSEDVLNLATRHLDELTNDGAKTVDGVIQNSVNADTTNKSGQVLDVNTPAARTVMEKLQTTDTWQSMTTFEKSSLVDVLKDAGLPEEISRNLFSENATSADFLRDVAVVLQRGNVSGNMQELINSNSFQDMLKDAVDKQWTLNPAQVQDKTQVENLYERLDKQTRAITDALTKAVNENVSQSTPLLNDLSNMNQNMDFMHQMNNIYQYVQLPLKMNGSDATGDLFVFTDKKSLANNDGNVSALLHLDMANLGPVDVYASITPGNNVFTKFYLQDDEMIDFISDHIHILNERLESRGYSTKAEMVIKGADKEDDVAYDILHASANSGLSAGGSLVAKKSFDMRA